MNEKIRLSKHTCERIAIMSEGHRVIIYLVMVFGAVGLAFVIVEYMKVILFGGMLLALGYFFVPISLKPRISDRVEAAKHAAKDGLVSYQRLRKVQKEEEKYEKKADEVLTSIEG